LNASNHPDHHITEKRGFKKKNSVEILFFLFGCLEFAFNGGIFRIFHTRLDRVDGGVGPGGDGLGAVTDSGVGEEGPVPEMQRNEGADAADEAVGDGVGEGHDHDGDERRHALAQILPVDLHHGLDHHDAHEHQRRPHGPRRDGRQQRREEEAQEEVARHRERRQPRAPALPDPRRRLNERRHGRTPQQRPRANRRRVAHEREVLPREVPLRVHKPSKLRHRKQRPRRVQNINVQKRYQRHPQLRRIKLAETQHPRRLLNLVHSHHMLEILIRRIPIRRLWKIRHLRVPEPRNRRHEHNPVNHRPLDILNQRIRNDQKPHHPEPERRILHRVLRAHNRRRSRPT
jgi:hypothetical protein